MIVAALAAALALAPGPAVTPAASPVAVGDRLAVALTGWPAGNVSVELCRDAAPITSTACAYAEATQTYVKPDGTGRATLTVVAPPGGCPCVVRVRSLTDGTARTAPVTITGIPVTAATDTAAPAPLVVASATVTAERSWAALAGGQARRTLTVVVRNPGGTPVTPHLSVTVARGTAAGTIVPAPAVGPIAPAGEAVIRVPVTLPAPAVGTYTIRADLTGVPEPIAVAADTTHQPWGIPAVLAALLAALLPRTLRTKPRTA